MLISAISFAGHTTEIDNQQVLNGQLFLADLNVTVGHVYDAAGQVIALGNTLSVHVETGNLNVINSQTLDTSGHAQSIINVDSASGWVTSNATLIGNSATITTCCGDITSQSTQTVEAGHTLSAVSNINVYDEASYISTAALSVGNAIGTQTWYGSSLDTVIDQTNKAKITSAAYIDGGGALYGSASVVSSAIANTASAGGEQTTTYAEIEQRSFGPSVEATGSITSPYVEHALVAVTATGNNAVVENSYGFLRSDVWQENTAYVSARADVHVGTWNGYNTASSYAVGNSNLTSNVGSDVLLLNEQINSGYGVEAITNFTGGHAGGVGDYEATQIASSAAFGNAVSGFLCSTCGGALTATNNQQNYASVSASTNIQTGSGSSVIGTATAIGNSATFHVSSGD